MKKLDVGELVKLARGEAVPEVNVVHEVIGILGAGRALVSNRPLMWIASFSSAAAACAAVVSYLVVRASMGGALSGMYEVISWAAQ